MAHLQYSEKERGFYLNTRKDLDLGWTFLDEEGNVVNKVMRHDLTPYETVVMNHQERNPGYRARSQHLRSNRRKLKIEARKRITPRKK